MAEIGKLASVRGSGSPRRACSLLGEIQAVEYAHARASLGTVVVRWASALPVHDMQLQGQRQL
jgi:hypothetical protein